MSEVRTEMLHLKGTLDFFVENKADQASLIELKDSLMRKIDQDYIDQTIQQSQNEITSLIINLKEEVRSRFSGIDNTLFQQLESKANLADIENILDTKVDSMNLAKHLEGFVSSVDLNNLRADLTQLQSGTGQVQQVETKISELESEIELKASARDVCTLIDMKANIDDVNKLVIDLH